MKEALKTAINKNTVQEASDLANKGNQNSVSTHCHNSSKVDYEAGHFSTCWKSTKIIAIPKLG